MSSQLGGSEERERALTRFFFLSLSRSASLLFFLPLPLLPLTTTAKKNPQLPLRLKRGYSFPVPRRDLQLYDMNELQFFDSDGEGKGRKEKKRREFSSSSSSLLPLSVVHAASLRGSAKKNASGPRRVRTGPSAGGGAKRTL